MNRRNARIWGLFSLFLTLTTGFLKADPYLSEREINHLLDLPASLRQNDGLLIRHKHIRSVQFLGGGISSDFGYVKKDGLIRHGLWMVLKPTIEEGWASASVIFNQPVNASRYNAVALWVRAQSPNFRFWLEFQDEGWKEFEALQARTNILPQQGLPVDQPFLVVVPFSEIFQESPLNFKKLSRIRFEFGSQTVGNKKGATLETLGLGFIEHNPPLEKISVFPQPTSVGDVAQLRGRLRKPSSSLPSLAATEFDSAQKLGIKVFSPAFYGKGVDQIPIKTQARPDARTMGFLDAQHAYPFLKKVNKPSGSWLLCWVGENKKGWVSEDLLLASEEKVEFFLSKDFSKSPIAPPEPVLMAKASDESAVPAQKEPKRWENLGRLFGRTRLPSATASKTDLSNSPATAADKTTGFPLKGVLILVGLLALFFGGRRALALLRKRPWASKMETERIWRAIEWPFLTPENQWDPSSEKIFWENQANQGVRFGWLSAEGLSLQRQENDPFMGESFLIRQIRLAKQANVELAPSVGFVRTLFRMETFFSDPDLFSWKPVPVNLATLSDQELKRKFLGFFPIWTPPFYQKKQKLPQRLLISYGKALGEGIASDSAQFNAFSPALRKVAVRFLKRLAKETSAIRIESPFSLLNQTLKYQLAKNPQVELPQTEFWAEVISEVKKDFPRVQFIADGQGFGAEALLKVGFNFVENEKVTRALTDASELENVRSLETELNLQRPQTLSQSLYYISARKDPQKGPASSRKTRLMASFLSFLPGKIAVDGVGWPDLSVFAQKVEKWPGLRAGFFKSLKTGSPHVFCLARWSDKSMVLAVFNFRQSPTDCAIQLGSLFRFFPQRAMILFHDPLHGDPLLRDLRDDGFQGPVLAVASEEVRESGLPLRVNGLSMKIFSVNLGRSLFSDVRGTVDAPSRPPSLPSQ